MKWSNVLNETLDYIEEHLQSDLDNTQIAENYSFSSFHFQRVFSSVANISLGEYIRNRKLAMAGKDIITSNEAISKIAFRYGYKYPESFSRAFKRFHGVSPYYAKKNMCVLKDYNRLNFKVSVTGGNTLEYKIVAMRSLKIAVKSIPYSGEMMSNDIQELALSFFKEFGENEVVGVSVCDDNNDNIYEYGLGYFFDSHSFLKEGFRIINIPKSEWLVIKCYGPIIESVDKAWREIYSGFKLNSYLPNYKYELEVYPKGNKISDDYVCEIYLPIMRVE